MKTVFRGYDREEVDALLRRCAASVSLPELAGFAPMGPRVTALDVERARFNRVFRGYDVNEVDDLLDRVVAALTSRDQLPFAVPPC